MITILITQDEKKLQGLLSRMLHKEGYVLPEGEEQDKILKLLSGRETLNDKLIEMENTLLQEKKGMLYRTMMETIEKGLIGHILERTEGNQLKASRLLGINRNTLRSKIHKLKIAIPEKW